MKKVVSYCLYGNKPLYCLGMVESVPIIQKLMPSWEIRVYYNGVPQKLINKLTEMGCNTIECVSRGTLWEGMFWRFNPWEDKDVDIWLSRDADSRISQREVNLIHEWVNSDYTFHMIRDNPYHNIQILGGTFGVKNYQFNNRYSMKKITHYINQSRIRFNKDNLKGPDQWFLCKHIWPLVAEDHLAHIIDYNQLRYGNDVIVPQVKEFVGDVVQPSAETVELYEHLLL